MENKAWWLIIEDFPDYLVSTDGRVSNGRKVLKAQLLNSGYLAVGLFKNGKRKNCTIHRLVAKTFLPACNGREYVNHKNGIKTDNRLENLEWCNLSENMKHGLALPSSAEARRKAAIRMRQVGKKYAKQNGEFLREISKKTSKPVLQFDLNGNFIAEYPSINYVEKNFASNVHGVLRGKYKQSGGYVWKLKENE